MPWYVEVKGGEVVGGPYASEDAAVEGGRVLQHGGIGSPLLVRWLEGDPLAPVAVLDGWEDVTAVLWGLQRTGDVMLVGLLKGFVAVYAL